MQKVIDNYGIPRSLVLLEGNDFFSSRRWRLRGRLFGKHFDAMLRAFDLKWC